MYIQYSVPVKDAANLTNTILEAVSLAGVRAIIVSGWAKLGITHTLPENIFLSDGLPHDYLFPLLDGVVHHGGA